MTRIIKFGDIEIQKQKFYQRKNIDINKTVISNKASFGKKEFKYLIGYNNAKKYTLMYISPKSECL